MPTDTAGRVFELMMVLEARWKKDKLRDQYPLVLLHHQAKNVVEYGKILTEWMRDNCKFGFESFHLLPQLSGLDELTASGAPCLVLASFSSLETGYARDVFFRWAHDPRNLVLFTDRAHPDTLGRLLVDFSLHRQPPPRSMPLVVHRRVALEGEELEAFQDKHRAIREARLQALREAREDRERQEAERAAEMELDSDEEDDAKTEQLVKSSRMFPAVEKQATFDDYGETIDHHDYMDRCACLLGCFLATCIGAPCLLGSCAHGELMTAILTASSSSSRQRQRTRWISRSWRRIRRCNRRRIPPSVWWRRWRCLLASCFWKPGAD
jgi:cleavage and polyadenylation specificity factor subunit 2